VTLLKQGKTLNEAAESMGQPVERLLGQEAVRQKLEDLMAFLPIVTNPEMFRMLILARQAATIMFGDDKDATAAAKMAAQAPELNLGNRGTQDPVLRIELSEDLKRLDPGDLWAAKEKPDAETKS
jgi:hypothetical protein